MNYHESKIITAHGTTACTNACFGQKKLLWNDSKVVRVVSPLVKTFSRLARRKSMPNIAETFQCRAKVATSYREASFKITCGCTRACDFKHGQTRQDFSHSYLPIGFLYLSKSDSSRDSSPRVKRTERPTRKEPFPVRKTLCSLT